MVEGVGVPAVRGHFAYRVTAVGQEIPVRVRADASAGKSTADAHHRHRFGSRYARSLFEPIRQRRPLVGGHRRHSLEGRLHQRPPPLLAGADSALSNSASRTLPSASGSRSVLSLDPCSGTNFLARYAANDVIVG